MEHKDYSLEIVNALLKDGNHARELAKLLNTNHMIIVRKLKILLKKNVVDFKREGNNKKYFIKNTIEARTYVYTAEYYKLLQTLIRYKELRVIFDKIQSDERIPLAILFGSYAKNNPNKDSDIDIYVASENLTIKKELGLLDSKLSVKIGKYNKDSPLIQEIEKNHVIIKGVEEYYEKTKFFEQTL